MRTNPLLDSFKYMFTFDKWTTVAFDVLLLAGILLAIWVYRRFPEQRTPYHVWTWFARTLMGAMWWQQVIWKTPPDFDGLRFWTNQMVQYASTDLQRALVSKVILAHFGFFAPQVFLVEVIISIALLLGLWSRFGSLLGAAMAVEPVAGSVSFAWRMAVAVHLSDHRDGAILRSSAGTQSGCGCAAGQGRRC